MNRSKSKYFGALVLLMLTMYAGTASAIGLLLPAVQSAREAAATAPLIGDFSSVGRVELVSTAVGAFPLLSFQSDPVDFGTGTVGIGIGELEPFSLKSLGPVANGGSFFDVFFELDVPDTSSATAEIEFVEVGGGTESSGGTYDSLFDIDVDIRLVEIGDPLNVLKFTESGRLRISGNWHAEGDQLVFDDPIMLDGLVSGKLTPSPVPLPAAVWLMFSGMGLLGLIGRRRADTLN